MEDYNKIGLNIWGIRGGYRSFCHTDNLDIETPEIKNTWKDIREFVYVTDLTVRFYALEFTPDYKVFTLYRPENDTSRTGAYVATTLYVSHTMKINRILDLMRQISDAYHKEHYDAFGNPNANPDYIQSYWQLVKNYAVNIVKESVVPSWESSRQDNLPRIMPFTNLSVVEDFFDKPYRKEFLRHQEVMFWDVDCLQNQQSHGVKFQKMEVLSLFDTDGKNIGPQFEGGSIKNKPQEGTITQFVREGVDITQDWQSSFFYDKTHVAITIKKPFHQPLTYQGPMIGVGSPFVKRGDDYEFSSRLMFIPRQYEIPVNVANMGNSSFTLYFGEQRVDIKDGRGVFKFDGSQANGACKVTLRPDGVNEIKVTDFAMSKFFAPGSDELDRMQPCIIESLKTVRFRFDQECRGKLNLRWYDVAIDFSTYNKAFETILPATSKASDFVFAVDGYKAEIKTADADSNSFDVTLTRESLVVDIVVPEALRRYVFSDSFILKVGGKSYKGTRAVIPFAERDSKWSLSLAVDNRGNTLDCEYDRKPNFDDVVLCPKLAVLVNRTNDTLQMTSPIFEVNSNSTVLVPAGYEVKLKDSERYDVDVVTNSTGIKTNTVTLKAGFASSSATSSTTGGYQGSYQGGGSSSGGPKDNKKYFGIYWYEDKECKLFENAVTKIFADGSLATMIDGRECILFFDKERRPVADKQKKHDAENKKNGFKVTVANGRCIVVSTIPKSKGGNGGKGGRGNGGGGNGDDKKKRWLLFGGVALAILLLLGGFILLGIKQNWFGGKNRYLRIEEVDGYTFDITNYNPAGHEGRKQGEPQTYFLENDCKEVTIQTIQVNGNILLFDTIVTIDKKWFTKKNNYTYTISFKDKLSSSRKPVKVENEKPVNDTLICQNFSNYLEKVWSLECSLNMLDSLEHWNTEINEKVVKGELNNKSSSKYMLKADIIAKITGKDHTQDEQHKNVDWVDNLLSRQREFFTNLESKSDYTDFLNSKGNRNRQGWFYNNTGYFTQEQIEVVKNIKNYETFNNAHLVVVSNKNSDVTYSQINTALN